MLEHLRSLFGAYSMSDHLQAIATIFSLVNPFVCALMFASLVHGQSRAAKLRAASSAMLTVAFVLVVAAVAGAHILKVFGISLDAFRVAGGAVLIMIGSSMLQGPGGSSSPEPQGTQTGNMSRLMLFAASPGTITGVITISAAHAGTKLPITALTAIAVVIAVTWLLLIASAMRGGTGKPPSVARDMTSRYMGLIIIAMGIQFALTGFKAFMAV